MLETDAISGVEVAATGFEPTTIYLANNLANQNGRMVKYLNFCKWLRVLCELLVFMDENPVAVIIRGGDK